MYHNPHGLTIVFLPGGNMEGLSEKIEGRFYFKE